MDLFSLNIGFKISLNTRHFDRLLLVVILETEFNTQILYTVFTVGFYLVLLLLCINHNNSYNHAKNKRPTELKKKKKRLMPAEQNKSVRCDLCP